MEKYRAAEVNPEDRRSRKDIANMDEPLQALFFKTADISCKIKKDVHATREENINTARAKGTQLVSKHKSLKVHMRPALGTEDAKQVLAVVPASLPMKNNVERVPMPLDNSVVCPCVRIAGSMSIFPNTPPHDLVDCPYTMAICNMLYFFDDKGKPHRRYVDNTEDKDMWRVRRILHDIRQHLRRKRDQNLQTTGLKKQIRVSTFRDHMECFARVLFDPEASRPYIGPKCIPPMALHRMIDTIGPVRFGIRPTNAIGCTPFGELRPWSPHGDQILSQNSSRRKVHLGLWLTPLDSKHSYPVAVKFVDDGNSRDGRSLRREIEGHLYVGQRLHTYSRDGAEDKNDLWPAAPIVAYYLDRENPGESMLVTRKLSGPDFFDIIRSEGHHRQPNGCSTGEYQYHKLRWCSIAFRRVLQLEALGLRHNDIKPDNLVLDIYSARGDPASKFSDVKLIDLGTACPMSARDFTGGTSWYESPEQKKLEYYAKRSKDRSMARAIELTAASDAWGIGLTVAEVLIGRRVVDVMKPPHGPGCMEFKGSEGWTVHPTEWISKSRKELKLDRPSRENAYPYCAEAAVKIFDMLVKYRPEERSTINEGLAICESYERMALKVVNSA